MEEARAKRLAWKNRFVLDGSEVGVGILKKLEPHCGVTVQSEEEFGHGITVKSVNPRGGAVHAHIVRGDHLISIDGHLIHHRDDFETHIHRKLAGDMVPEHDTRFLISPDIFCHGLFFFQINLHVVRSTNGTEVTIPVELHSANPDWPQDK